MTLLTVPSIKQLPHRLQYLIHELQQMIVVNPEVLQYCLKLANIQSEDLKLWQQFNHPAHQSYGSAIIYQGKAFELVAVSWIPGDFSAIHTRNCIGAIQSFGNAEYSQFQYDGDLLTTHSISSFRAGMVRSTYAHQLNQMGNPSQQPFMSLHVYVRTPNQIAMDTQVFDLYDASIKCARNAFFCLTESGTLSKQKGLRGNRLTTLRHHQQMLAQILRIQHESIQNRYLQCMARQLSAEISFLRQ